MNLIYGDLEKLYPNTKAINADPARRLHDFPRS